MWNEPKWKKVKKILQRDAGKGEFLSLGFFLVRQQKDEDVGGRVLGGAKGMDRGKGEDW